MSIKISQDYIDNFKSNTQLLEALKVLKDKEYDEISIFENDLKILLKGDLKKFKKELIDKLLIEDDSDTLSEELFENGTIYPYDPSKADIDIREDVQTVYELAIRKWDQDKLILDPEFQRNFVWKREQQSQFIESIILNFPLPPMYINKNKKGKYIVVDGRQRLTTLRSFLKNEFQLEGLRALPQLNDKSFEDLIAMDSNYQTKIEDKKLLVYLIQPSVPLEMVYDIFNRINTGGTQLQRQEIRNCIYMGKATELIKKLSSKSYFKRAIDNGISPLRKKDQEAVLRYLSFKVFDYKNDYSGSMNDFVENAMKRINHGLEPDKIQILEDDFERVMKKTFEFFGDSNFRIPTESTRGRINLAIMESVSNFFSINSDVFLDKNKSSIINNYFEKLLKDSDYKDSIRSSTSDTQRVKTRFDKAIELLGTIEK
jgi:hypothetical protein